MEAVKQEPTNFEYTKARKDGGRLPEIPSKSGENNRERRPDPFSPVVPIKRCQNLKVSPEDKFFWESWNTHREYLKKLSILWMNVSSSDAEDAFSDATIRAYEKYKFLGAQVSNERAWFARLLHNICIDRHRINKRRKALTERIREIDSILYSGNTCSIRTPEAEIINEELKSDIEAAIRELPERLRKPLFMRLVQGEEYDKIAEELGISNDNARKRVQQARAYLRTTLAHHRG